MCVSVSEGLTSENRTSLGMCSMLMPVYSSAASERVNERFINIKRKRRTNEARWHENSLYIYIYRVDSSMDDMSESWVSMCLCKRAMKFLMSKFSQKRVIYTHKRLSMFRWEMSTNYEWKEEKYIQKWDEIERKTKWHRVRSEWLSLSSFHHVFIFHCLCLFVGCLAHLMPRQLVP